MRVGMFLWKRMFVEQTFSLSYVIIQGGTVLLPPKIAADFTQKNHPQKVLESKSEHSIGQLVLLAKIWAFEIE